MRHLVAIAAGALTVAACSDDGRTSVPTPTSTTTSATTSTATSVATSRPDVAADTTVSPTDAPTGPPSGPVAAPVRDRTNTGPIYFVMPDRFANGDPANDRGGLEGDQLVTGFDPTDTAYHHGGDLIGLRSRLDYLEGLGIRALWITPPFTNRYVQGDGTVDGSSSSYHGYWQIDWSRVDPHLGTDADMHALIADAHDRGMLVYFDIVVNHTGDVITYEGGSNVYVSQNVAPYLDASGVAFDPATVAGSEAFPPLDAASSFPYVPTFDDPADATVKWPAWLNDPTMYHNRGNSTFAGESSTFGDFFGLDDLFTERPAVVDGMIDLYGGIVERYGIDGFRVDTMKHVDLDFWRRFAPAIRARAAELGRPDFAMFGEVFSTDPIEQSAYTNLGVPSTLDFVFDAAVRRYVVGGGADAMADAFATDDWFTDTDNNASMQVTFVGNHDEGRLGAALLDDDPSATDDELLARARLAHDLLFLSRGTPVVYYGDEQGFTGNGGDQLARQDMFATRTPEYADDDAIGTDADGAADHFRTDHPLYRHLGALAGFRAAHPAFTTGAHVVLATEGPVLAFSRIDRDERIEYVVLTNSNASITVPARFQVLTPDTDFVRVWGPDAPVVHSGTDGEVLIDVPPLTTVVLEATAPNLPPAAATPIRIDRPDAGATIPTNRYRIEARIADRRYAEVTFAVALDGAEPQVIGVDDAPPYRVYWDNSVLPAGTEVEVFATVADGSGRTATDRVIVALGDRS
ncbi:MAG: alpha-amylase family glycosyl hydrolase [Ilumatobacteraceae bacterium]